MNPGEGGERYALEQRRLLAGRLASHRGLLGWPHLTLCAIPPLRPLPRVLHRAPFTAEGWLFELKHDGVRAFVRAGRKVEIMSRSGRSMTEALREIVHVLATVDRDVVLDGELVVPDERGHADFEELRRRAFMRRTAAIREAVAAHPAALIVFDVLQADGVDMRTLPLIERKAWLAANICPCAGLQIIEGVELHGEALFALAVEQDVRGYHREASRCALLRQAALVVAQDQEPELLAA